MVASTKMISVQKIPTQTTPSRLAQQHPIPHKSPNKKKCFLEVNYRQRPICKILTSSAEEVDFDTDVETAGTVEDKHEDEEDQKKYHVWNIAYYRGYFNVDTIEVGNRILRSVAPYSMSFFDSVKENPDLYVDWLHQQPSYFSMLRYGPFWIATTLIFVMAASANFASYLDNPDNFSYDFRTVSTSPLIPLFVHLNANSD